MFVLLLLVSDKSECIVEFRTRRSVATQSVARAVLEVRPRHSKYSSNQDAPSKLTLLCV